MHSNINFDISSAMSKDFCVYVCVCMCEREMEVGQD